MLSFWEKESFTSFDVVVIGGGITGLSTAISIKQKHPDLSVVIIERGTLPSGASTKNAGFACFGSLTEIVDDIDSFGSQKAQELVKLRLEGLHLLRNRLGDSSMDYEQCGGYELITPNEVGMLDRIDEVNQLLADCFEKKVFSHADDKIKQFGFKDIEALLFNPFEGALHTGKMMKSLIQLASSLGINYLNGANVQSLRENSNNVNLELQLAGEDAVTLVSGKQVVICTNAFTSRLKKGIQIQPGRGIVLVTKPIKGLAIKGTFHLNKGYYYFRNVGDRLLLGGGRNLDLEGEATTDFRINPIILTDLKAKLETMIIPNIPYEIDMTWAGIMAFGEDKVPILQFDSPHVLIATKLGGMGVAIGSKLGDMAANMLLEKL